MTHVGLSETWVVCCIPQHANMPTSSGKNIINHVFSRTEASQHFQRTPCRVPEAVSQKQSESFWMGTSQKPGLPEKVRPVRPQQLKLVNLTLQWFYGRFFRYIMIYQPCHTILWLWPRFLHDSHHYLGTTFGL